MFLAILNLAAFFYWDDNIAHVQGINDAKEYMAQHPQFRNENIASFDAGYVGFVLQNRVTNIDGLINSRSYFDTVIQGEKPLSEYLRERDIKYVVNMITTDVQRVYTSSFRGLQHGEYQVEFLSPTYTGPFEEKRTAVILRLVEKP